MASIGSLSWSNFVKILVYQEGFHGTSAYELICGTVSPYPRPTFVHIPLGK